VMRRSRWSTRVIEWRLLTRCIGVLVPAVVVLGTGGLAQANEPDVMAARAKCNAIRACTFEVMVRHADVGGSHYADRWEVIGPDGEVLGTRVLRHPHVHEQPFERGLVGVEIPAGVTVVTVRAHDNVHGYGGKEIEVPLVFPDARAVEGPENSEVDPAP
jgi:hypothetical protein